MHIQTRAHTCIIPMKTSSGNSKNFPDAQQHGKSFLWLHLMGYGQLSVVDYVSLFKTELGSFRNHVYDTSREAVLVL